MTAEGEAPESFYPEQEAFIGRGGTLLWPEAVVCNRSGVESGRKIDGQETLGGLRFAEKTLQEGESCEYTLLIGAIQGEENIARIREQFSDSGKVSSSLKETRQYWKEKNKVHYHTADPLFDQFMNWVNFQPELRRIYGCSFLPHHDYGKVALSSIKANEGRSSLVREGKKVSSYLTEVSKVVPKIVIVKSNHDEHLERYLEEGRPFKDPENFYTSLDLYKTLIEGKDPLRYLIETKLGLKIKNIKWLKSDESYKKYGVELGMHGHRGANGSRGSAQIFEKAVGKAITAHTHTASIMRTIFTVGIGGAKDQGYNKGLSSWTRTSALLYPNGNVQLINFLDYKGDYRWKID
jgi:hypothetical protein